MFLIQLIKKILFDRDTDRIGPDIPFTHYKLYFKKSGKRICKKKIKFFDDSAEIRPGVYAICCSQISIGKNVVIRPGTMLFADSQQKGEIIIEDDVLMGSCVHIYVTNHEYSNPNVPIYYQGDSPKGSVLIKKGCWIGANVTILKGVTIGENSVVAAGSVVVKDVPPRTVVAGNPAKVLKKIEG